MFGDKMKRCTLGCAVAVLTLMLGCGDWKVGAANLTARSTGDAQTPSCASCHPYPLNDSNHLYHLFAVSPDKRFNGKITCLDCHNQSIRWRIGAIPDTVFTDSLNNYSTFDHPVIPGVRSFADTLRNYPLVRIDTLRLHLPYDVPKRSGSGNAAGTNAAVGGNDGSGDGGGHVIAEYMTALAHLNNTVDVEFDARISDTVRFKGQAAGFSPKEETCSAIACHPGDKPYRWAAPSKGLSVLKE